MAILRSSPDSSVIIALVANFGSRELCVELLGEELKVAKERAPEKLQFQQFCHVIWYWAGRTCGGWAR